MKRLFEQTEQNAAAKRLPKLPVKRMLFAAGTEEAIDGGITRREMRLERRETHKANQERQKKLALFDDPFDTDNDASDKENSESSPNQIRYQRHSPHHTPTPVKVSTPK